MERGVDQLRQRPECAEPQLWENKGRGRQEGVVEAKSAVDADVAGTLPANVPRRRAATIPTCV